MRRFVCLFVMMAASLAGDHSLIAQQKPGDACPVNYRRGIPEVERAREAKKARLRAEGMPERFLHLLDKEECVACIEKASDSFHIQVEYNDDANAPAVTDGRRISMHSFKWDPQSERQVREQLAAGKIRKFYIFNTARRCSCCPEIGEDGVTPETYADWDPEDEVNKDQVIEFDGPEDLGPLPKDLEDPPPHWINDVPNIQQFTKPPRRGVLQATCKACEGLAAEWNRLESNRNFLWDRKLALQERISIIDNAIGHRQNQIARLEYQQLFPSTASAAGRQQLESLRKINADQRSDADRAERELADVDAELADIDAKMPELLKQFLECEKRCQTALTQAGQPQTPAAAAGDRPFSVGATVSAAPPKLAYPDTAANPPSLLPPSAPAGNVTSANVTPPAIDPALTLLPNGTREVIAMDSVRGTAACPACQAAADRVDAARRDLESGQRRATIIMQETATLQSARSRALGDPARLADIDGQLAQLNRALKEAAPRLPGLQTALTDAEAQLAACNKQCATSAAPTAAANTTGGSPAAEPTGGAAAEPAVADASAPRAACAACEAAASSVRRVQAQVDDLRELLENLALLQRVSLEEEGRIREAQERVRARIAAGGGPEFEKGLADLEARFREANAGVAKSNAESMRAGAELTQKLKELADAQAALDACNKSCSTTAPSAADIASMSRDVDVNRPGPPGKAACPECQQHADRLNASPLELVSITTALQALENCNKRCTTATVSGNLTPASIVPVTATDPVPAAAACPACRAAADRVDAGRRDLASAQRRVTIIMQETATLQSARSRVLGDPSRLADIDGQLAQLNRALNEAAPRLPALQAALIDAEAQLAACNRQCATAATANTPNTTGGSPAAGPAGAPAAKPVTPAPAPTASPGLTMADATAGVDPVAACPACAEAAAAVRRRQEQYREVLNRRAPLVELLNIATRALQDIEQEQKRARARVATGGGALAEREVATLQAQYQGSMEKFDRLVEDLAKNDTELRDATANLAQALKELDECNKRCTTAASNEVNSRPGDVANFSPPAIRPRPCTGPECGDEWKSCSETNSCTPIDDDCGVPGTCTMTGGDPPAFNLMDPSAWGTTANADIEPRVQIKFGELAIEIVIRPVQRADIRSWFNPLGLLARRLVDNVERWRGSAGPRPLLNPRDLATLENYSNAQAIGLPKGVHVLLSDRGGSTGKTLAMQVLNLTGQPVRLSSMPFAIEPIKQQAQAGVQAAFNRLSKAAAVKVDLAGYCLEFLKAPPSANQIFRLAPPAVQKQFASMSKVLRSAYRVQHAGLLRPDSNPAAYTDAIKQWALWTVEQNLNENRFTEAFLGHTKKNVEAAGQQWSKPADDMIRKVSPNRWRDIVKVLQGAGLAIPQ